MRRLAVLIVLAACGGETPDPFSCDGYVRPVLPARGCADPSDPHALVDCDTGSALTGSWVVDGDGLPAYDFAIDERCDDAATAYTPRSPDRALRDPIFVIGDGYGTVAMAHASGGIDLYMQDRGHAWPIRVDPWHDEARPDFAPQLGAAIAYVVDGENVMSLRFEDLPVQKALAIQTRRFGVGYAETATTLDDVTVTRRTYALPGTRALVTEVTLANRGARERTLGVVELDDANLYEAVAELVTSDLLNGGITREIDRRRRGFDDQLLHHARYDAAARVASLATTAMAPPVGPGEHAPADHYPATLWLAALDQTPDAAWLSDDELWDSTDRSPPHRLAGAGDAGERTRELPGANQPGLLALRVPVVVPAGGTAVVRFALGVVPAGDDPIAAATRVRDARADAHAVAAAWRDRLVWAAVPGQPHAGALQRELAWSSYSLQALATYDAYHQRRLLGQGGSYKYIHGIDGAIGDYALFAEAALPIDPELARDTLALSLATQRAPALPDGGRYPYATTGVGDYTDMIRYDLRSDVYSLLPSEIARYVAFTRDTAFLDASVPYWPRERGDAATVLEHLRLTQSFADQKLGFGAHGLVAMGTNDYADGVLQTAAEPATPSGASSTFNAWLLVGGFALAADIVRTRDGALAQRYTDVRTDQLARLEQFAWTGTHYERGFVDSGRPLGAASLYLEPQVLPIVADAIAPDRRAALLALVARTMDTPIGPMTVVGAASGDIDQPQVGGVWPVSSVWLTDAYARADPARGWDSLVRNTLFAHAAAFPHLWYGVWSGPDSYYGPDAARPGEADAHLATALTDYPVFNVHAHASTLRALLAVAGIQPTAAGFAISPRLPTETFSIAWPRITLASTPTSIGGSLKVAATGAVTLHVTLPSGLRAGGVHVTADGVSVPVQRAGDIATFTLTATADTSTRWQITH